MKEKICCFTGHRHIPFEYARALAVALDAEIEARIADGYTVFRAGGAYGFDTLAALRVILKKRKYGFIRLELCLPCKNQTAYWGKSDIDIYNMILANADDVRYVGEKYTSNCMMARNRMLVDGSDCCVGFCIPTAGRGGSRYTLNYAARQGVEVKNLFNYLDRF